VSSFLTAHQHIIGYSVPYNGLENAIKQPDRKPVKFDTVALLHLPMFCGVIYTVSQKITRCQLLHHFLMTKLSTPPFNIFKQLKKHIALLTYLLPCPAASILITSSRSWTVGHLARPSTECSW